MGSRKKAASVPVPSDHGGSTEDAFMKIADALEDADYPKVLKLVDGGLFPVQE